MKKHKFLLVSILLVGALSSELFAQDSGPSMIDILQKYKWKEFVTEGIECVYEFVGDKDLKISAKFQFEEKIGAYEATTLYYLTNTMDTEFDESKVGKNRNGDYLTYKNEKSGYPVTVRIVELTTKEFRYENLKSKKIGSMYPVSK